MRRRISNVTAFASLVLLVGGIVMWVRSYRNWDVFVHRGNVLIVVLELNDEASYVRFKRLVSETSAERAERFWRLAHAVKSDNEGGNARKWRGWLGFGTGRAFVMYAINNSLHKGLSAWFRLVAVPMWFVVTLLAVPPAVWIVGWRRRRRRAKGGLCARCGYDVRATPERCPECGCGATPAGERVGATS